jgi:hypothetical protein
LVTRKVDRRGVVGYDGLGIIIPRRYAGATVRIFRDRRARSRLSILRSDLIDRL